MSSVPCTELVMSPEQTIAVALIGIAILVTLLVLVASSNTCHICNRPLK